MNNEVKALERRVEELEDQLKRARVLLHQAQCDAMNIHDGDLVKDHKGQYFKVGKVECWWGKPSIHGYRKLKGGGWHKTLNYIGKQFTRSDAADRSEE